MKYFLLFCLQFSLKTTFQQLEYAMNFGAFSFDDKTLEAVVKKQDNVTIMASERSLKEAIKLFSEQIISIIIHKEVIKDIFKKKISIKKIRKILNNINETEEELENLTYIYKLLVYVFNSKYELNYKERSLSYNEYKSSNQPMTLPDSKNPSQLAKNITRHDNSFSINNPHQLTTSDAMETDSAKKDLFSNDDDENSYQSIIDLVHIIGIDSIGNISSHPLIKNMKIDKNLSIEERLLEIKNQIIKIVENTQNTKEKNHNIEKIISSMPKNKESVENLMNLYKVMVSNLYLQHFTEYSAIIKSSKKISAYKLIQKLINLHHNKKI